MFIVLIRTVFLYFLIISILRLMGKRQIGELQPYEFVITILVSDLGALPMQDTRLPLILGIVPIITLLFIKTLLSQLQLKSQTARKILEGEPSILIYKGKIHYENLKRQQINLDELMEELRLSGYFDLKLIQYAILENNGQMSFLTYDSDTLNNKENDINISTKTFFSKNDTSDKLKLDLCPKLPVIYVLDGKINNNTLTKSNENIKWVEDKLKEFNVNSIKDVIIFMKDTAGKFIYQKYDDLENDI